MDKEKIASRFFDAFEDITDGRYIFMCDMKTNKSRWSKAFVEEFGLPGEYMMDAGLEWEKHIHPMDRDRYHASIEALFTGESTRHHMVYRAMNKDGEYVTCTCKGVVFKDENGDVDLFCGVIKNHSVASEFDPVTGLYTKARLLRELAGLKQDKIKYNILFVGFYNFAAVNNVYGYEAGNKILRLFAEKLLAYAGDCDVFHTEGTKFAVLSYELDFHEMTEIYEELSEYARHSMEVNGMKLTMNIGGSCTEVSNFYVDEHTIFFNGMRGLAESMNVKHGELVAFGNNTLDSAHERVVIVNALRNSINEGCKGFYMNYQPIVSAQTGELVGAEALVRWSRDPFGNVPPADFIFWLESDPMFYDLGLWILRTSMKDFKDKVLSSKPNAVININIAYTQLERQNFRKDLLAVIDEVGFPKENLCLELTERCRLLDKNFLKNELLFIKSQGIKIAFDDFGTGFSSLELTLFLPLDAIKIDRSFVINIENDPKKQSVVGAILRSANELGTESTVEGIETESMREMLSGLKATKLQGYFYSRPVTMDELVELPVFKK